ncbi:hypothetical protein VIGAN_07154600, partial [Vigna angularis var. angularis]
MNRERGSLSRWLLCEGCFFGHPLCFAGCTSKWDRECWMLYWTWTRGCSNCWMSQILMGHGVLLPGRLSPCAPPLQSQAHLTSKCPKYYPTIFP